MIPVKTGQMIIVTTKVQYSFVHHTSFHAQEVRSNYNIQKFFSALLKKSGMALLKQ
jgi:hypothetical protein